MSIRTTLNEKYEKEYLGWKSQEKGVSIGDMRIIDNSVHVCIGQTRCGKLSSLENCIWTPYDNPFIKNLAERVEGLHKLVTEQEEARKSIVKTLQDAGVTYRNDELYSFHRWGFGVDSATSIKNNDVKTDVSKVDNRLYFLAEALGLEWKESTSKSGYVKKAVKKAKKK